jgi:hypothetical protein
VDDGRVELACSEDLLAELTDVLDRPRIRARVPPEDAALFRQLYAQQATFFEPGANPQVCRDPRDDYLLSLAAVAQADFLVTRDEDLLVLEHHHSTEIIYPARFLQILAEGREPDTSA